MGMEQLQAIGGLLMICISALVIIVLVEEGKKKTRGRGPWDK